MRRLILVIKKDDPYKRFQSQGHRSEHEHYMSCINLKFAPFVMGNRTRKSQPTGIEHVPFLRVESTVGYGLTNQSRGEKLERKKSRWRTYQSNVISASLRQPHLLHEMCRRLQTVISSLSTVAPTLFIVVDAQAVKINIHI